MLAGFYTKSEDTVYSTPIGIVSDNSLNSVFLNVLIFRRPYSQTFLFSNTNIAGRPCCLRYSLNLFLRCYLVGEYYIILVEVEARMINEGGGVFFKHIIRS